MSRVDDSPGTTSSSRSSHRSGGLRTIHLAGMLMATHSPLVALYAAVVTAYGSRVVATPLIFLLAGFILFGFVLGYSGLGRRIRHPGGLYVLITRGLGRPVGLGAAVLLFVSYIGVSCGIYGFGIITLRDVISATLGVDPPTIVSLLITAAVVFAATRLRVRVLSQILLVVVSLQLLTLIWFVIAALGKPAAGHVSYQALDPGWLLSGSFGVALIFCVQSFFGSEGGTFYSEDLKNPERSIPRAAYISYGLTAGILVVAAWAVSVVVSPEVAATPTGIYLPQVLGQLVGANMAETVNHMMSFNLWIGLVTTAIAQNNAASRMIGGLSRDGLLPRIFEFRPETGRPPLAAMLVQPTIAVVGSFIATFTALQATPLWLAVSSGLGIVAVMMFASAASTIWFLRGEADEGGFFGWEGQVIAGVISVVTTGGLFLYGITNILEVAPGSPSFAKWLVGVLLGGVFLVGVILALVIKAQRPDIYARLGGSGTEAQRKAAAPVPPPPPEPASTTSFPLAQPAQPTPQPAHAGPPSYNQDPFAPQPSYGQSAGQHGQHHQAPAPFGAGAWDQQRDDRAPYAFGTDNNR